MRSFFHGDWELADYPVRVFERDASPDLGRMRPFTWTAQVINWWYMRGDGYSREEALEDLRRAFEGFRATNPLPRPGRGAELKITFAPSDLLDRHRQTAEELVESLFGIPPNDCFLSDDSTLWDFHQESLNDQFAALIRDRYGVDITDLQPPTVWAIAERIDQKRPWA